MDSLLLVLTVVGIIMVLAGIARMRKKRRGYGWDDIDHSVLFSKSGAGAGAEADTETSQHQEPQLGQGLNNYAGDVDPAPGFESVVAIDEPSLDLSREQNKAARPSLGRSLFGKLKRDNVEPVIEDEISIVQRYKQGAPDWVVVLNVMAPEGQQFVGSVLIEAVNSLGMSFGEMDIFHHQKDGSSLYSMVNMVKPGTFDLNAATVMTTPGVSFFVQLPNQYGNGLEIFDNMVMTAQHLADTLGGELRDERRNVLTSSATDYMRQQIAEYDCKWQMASQ